MDRTTSAGHLHDRRYAEGGHDSPQPLPLPAPRDLHRATERDALLPSERVLLRRPASRRVVLLLLPPPHRPSHGRRGHARVHVRAERRRAVGGLQPWAQADLLSAPPCREGVVRLSDEGVATAGGPSLRRGTPSGGCAR